MVPNGRLKLREFGDGSGELIAYERANDAEPKESRYTVAQFDDVRALAEALIRFDGVQAFLLLQLIGAELRQQADAAALLAHIEHDASSLLFNHHHCCMKLILAITSKRTQRIAGKAFRMYAYQHRIFSDNFTFG